MKLKNVKPTKFDNLQTQQEAINFLVQNVNLKNIKVIWECCSGDGNISDFLSKKGFIVLRTDLKTGVDFLVEQSFEFDCIITNPPYSIKNKILKRCFEIGKPFALLLPLTTLESKERNILLKGKNIQLLIPNKRFDFTGKKNCWFATAWFCWKMNLPNQLNFCEVSK